MPDLPVRKLRTLSIKIIGHEASSRFKDQRPRIVVSVEEAERMLNQFTMAVDSLEQWPLDARIEFHERP